ncbi:MAG: short-chain dehydrogenase/reductase [Acidobacteria bacterium]|nr:MAG: short-chain dehydrogenase/reductase [Acidobacteriota bacterium]
MKVALVTGVSSGIGRATAVRLAQDGYRTFGTVREAVAPHENIELVRVDVRDRDSVEEAVASVFETAGRIDVLVNSAGVAMVSAAEETTPEEARDLFDTNFFGVMRMTQAVLPAMRAQRSGRIINISSVLGFLPAPFMSVYAATKHAVEGYSESLDHEVRNFGVRVIVVEPGFTRTNLSRHNGNGHPVSEYNMDRERAAASIEEHIKHGADPAAVADVVARAATARTPALHYQVGANARLLRVLRSIAPAGLVDRGVRKTFGVAS